MSTNPYAPPLAQVADVPITSIEKPIQINLAVRMLWGAIGLGIISTAIFVTSINDVPTELLVRSLGTSLFSWCVIAWLSVKISRGRNWARIVLLVLVLFAIGTLTVSIIILKTFSFLDFGEPLLSWISLKKVIDITRIILQYTATALLFIGPGRRWFAPRE